MLAIIIKRIKERIADFRQNKIPFREIVGKITQGVRTIRFAMLATYIAVIVMTLALMSAYIIGVLSENLYSDKKNHLFAKANIISQTASSVWDGNDSNVMYLRLEDITERSLAGTSIRGVVTNTAYTVMYDTNRESNMAGRVFMRSVLKRALDGEQTDSSFEADAGKTITVAVPIEKDGEIMGGVYLAENVSSISETIGTIKTSLLIFSIAIVAAIGLLSIGASYIITRPLFQIKKVARAISKGDFSQRADTKGVSELAQMGNAINYMCDELNELDEKRRNFVSDVSHELKTPMAGIKLLCDSLVEAENPDMNTVREFLGDMSEEIDRLTRLINRLLTLSRLDANTELSLSEVDISALCEGVVRSLRQFADEKGITLVFEGSEDKCLVSADYDKIYEAVYNLADNAIKYTDNGGNVSVRVGMENAKCTIAIQDNGGGIPDSEKLNVFERFYRLDDSRARETGGTGLGLAISKEAVMLHNGTIEVTDAPGGGSIFTIELPG